MEGMITLFHADSLGGPMSELKNVFEARNPDIKIYLSSGRSTELAGRILRGDICDIFAPSDPQVVKGLIGKRVNDREAAAWYISFSANELVIITHKGNPLRINRMSDLIRDDVVMARVSGASDLGTNRTIEFIQNALTEEGYPDLAQQIIGRAIQAGTVPEVLQAVQSGKANAGIVYLSAAVSISNEINIVRFPATVNLSNKIVNVITIPGTAKNVKAADNFIKLLLSVEGREILERTGQPPIVPPVVEGIVPFKIPME